MNQALRSQNGYPDTFIVIISIDHPIGCASKRTNYTPSGIIELIFLFNAYSVHVPDFITILSIASVIV